jgi:hypothetical protein
MSGVNVTPAPADAHTDGINRAVRSFVGGAIATGLQYGGVGLLTSVGAIRWTHSYWVAMGTQAVGVVMYGVVAYAMRRFAPPQN